MRNKVILVDCDGVLLDWTHSFTQWMHRHGYVEKTTDTYDIAERYDISTADSKRLIAMFNESAAIRKLSPFKDAIKYVKKLHAEHGYVFHAITSLSTESYAQHLRTKNLQELFGKTAFEKFIYLGTAAPKDEALKPYKDTECFWIEDLPTNVDVGCQLGLDGILLAHSYNSGYDGTADRVQNWKEIYNIITGE